MFYLSTLEINLNKKLVKLQKKSFMIYNWTMFFYPLYINLACPSVWVSVCVFVSNKRQNGWTDWAQ